MTLISPASRIAASRLDVPMRRVSSAVRADFFFAGSSCRSSAAAAEEPFTSGSDREIPSGILSSSSGFAAISSPVVSSSDSPSAPEVGSPVPLKLSREWQAALISRSPSPPPAISSMQTSISSSARKIASPTSVSIANRPSRISSRRSSRQWDTRLISMNFNIRDDPFSVWAARSTSVSRTVSPESFSRSTRLRLRTSRYSRASCTNFSTNALRSIAIGTDSVAFF